MTLPAYYSISSVLYVMLLLSNILISMVVATVAYRHRRQPGGLALALLMLAIIVWSFARIFEFTAADIPSKIFWSKVEYIGTVSVPVLLLIFALVFTGQTRWLQFPFSLLYWIIPVSVLFLAWTNEYHQLIWPSFTPIAGTHLIVYGHGLGFWMMIAYHYLVLLMASVILFRAAIRLRDIYRWQAVVIILAIFPPWLVNVFYNFEIILPLGWDLTPICFAISGMLLTWSFVRLHFLKLVPIARDLVVDRMEDAMLVLDRRDRLVDLNPAARALPGCTAAAIGQPLAEVLHLWPELVACLRQPGSTRAEISLNHNGVLRYFEVQISSLTDKREQFIGRLVVLRDITDRRLAADALRQHAAELEVRTQELDTFAHMVAHDLKSPLGTILGYTQFLTESYDELSAEEVQVALAGILKTGQKIDDIIEALLLLAGVRRMPVEAVPLAMAQLIDEVLVRLRGLMVETAAEVIVPPTWPTAMGYGPWVEEVWTNYLSNAIKYGGQPPQVELGATVQHDGQVKFWVRDNGPGLTEEQQRQLFSIFTRLNQSKVAGHGLGLSIVKRIVERLGGEVGIESQVAQGSTFYFTLPNAAIQ